MFFFFFNDTATTEIYTLSLHDALPISNLGEAHQHLGVIYLHLGLLDEAVAELRNALTLNPFDVNAQRRIGIAQIYRGQYEDGLTLIRQAGPEANPALWSYQVAWALLYLGRDAEASAFMEEYLRAHPKIGRASCRERV